MATPRSCSCNSVFCKRCLEVNRKRLNNMRKRGDRTKPNKPGCRCLGMNCLTCINRQLYRAKRRQATGAKLLPCDLREIDIPKQRRRYKAVVRLASRPQREPFDRTRYQWDRTKGKHENWRVDD
jgi:hypothetical protein